MGILQVLRFEFQKFRILKILNLHLCLYFCLPYLLAARLMESMDPDIDPCEDFFEYSCGSWNRLNDIPDDRSFYNTFAKLRDIILVQLKGKS